MENPRSEEEKIIKDIRNLFGLKKKQNEPLINKYNWEEINYPSKKDVWKKFEKNNVTIALNILYTKKIYPTYVSNHITQIVKNKLFF